MERLAKCLPKIKAHRDLMCEKIIVLMTSIGDNPESEVREMVRNEYSKVFGIRLYQHSFKKYSPSPEHIVKLNNLIDHPSLIYSSNDVSLCTEEIVHGPAIINAWMISHIQRERYEKMLGRLIHYDDSGIKRQGRIISDFTEEMAEEILDFLKTID
jgi:hypothetical protein